MRSDQMKKGIERAPHRSLFKALCFTDEELEYLISRGAVPFSLGNLTLRSETAAITATAIAVNRYI